MLHSSLMSSIVPLLLLLCFITVELVVSLVALVALLLDLVCSPDFFLCLVSSVPCDVSHGTIRLPDLIGPTSSSSNYYCCGIHQTETVAVAGVFIVDTSTRHCRHAPSS